MIPISLVAVKGKGDGLCKKRVTALIHEKGSAHGRYDDEEGKEKDEKHLGPHPDSFHLPHHILTRMGNSCIALGEGGQERAPA